MVRKIIKIKKVIICLGIVILSISGCKKEESAKDFYKKGVEFFKNGKIEEAVLSLQKAVEKNTEKAEYYIVYGMALIEIGEYKTAQTQFDKVILEKENRIIRENNKQAYRGKGICYFYENEYEKAIEMFQKALEISDLEEVNLDLLLYQADAQTKLGDYEEALKSYNKILEQKKNNADLYGKRAAIEKLLGKYDLAIKDYDKAISMNGNSYDLYFGKYNLLINQGNTSDANEVLKKALSIKTKTDEDYYNVAKIHFYQEDFTTAQTELQTAIENGFTEAWYFIGQIYEIQNDFTQAIASYEKYLEANSEIRSAWIYNHLGVCYMMNEEYAKAAQMIREGIDLNDYEVMKELLYNEVATYEYLGDFNTALKKAEEYLILYPQEEEMRNEISFLKTRVVEKGEEKQDDMNKTD